MATDTEYDFDFPDDADDRYELVWGLFEHPEAIAGRDTKEIMSDFHCFSFVKSGAFYRKAAADPKNERELYREMQNALTIILNVVASFSRKRRREYEELGAWPAIREYQYALLHRSVSVAGWIAPFLPFPGVDKKRLLLSCNELLNWKESPRPFRERARKYVRDCIYLLDHPIPPCTEQDGAAQPQRESGSPQTRQEVVAEVRTLPRRRSIVYHVERCSLVIDGAPRDDELNSVEQRLLLHCAIEEARAPRIGSVSDMTLLRSGRRDGTTSAFNAYRNLLRKMRRRNLSFDLGDVLVRYGGVIRIHSSVNVIRPRSLLSSLSVENAAEMMLSRLGDEDADMDDATESH